MKLQTMLILFLSCQVFADDSQVACDEQEQVKVCRCISCRCGSSCACAVRDSDAQTTSGMVRCCTCEDDSCSA